MNEKKKSPSYHLKKYLLRFPPGMREQLERAAEQNGTRLNQEIVRRLTASLRSDRDKEMASPAELIELAQGLTEEQRMVLQRLAALLKVT